MFSRKVNALNIVLILQSECTVRMVNSNIFFMYSVCIVPPFRTHISIIKISKIPIQHLYSLKARLYRQVLNSAIIIKLLYMTED